MTSWWLALLYCALILLASLAGGLLPIWVRLTHRRMQIAISFVAGFMLGIGLLHMMPHALMDAPVEHVALAMLAGFLAMFFLERFFSFHHHDVAADGEAAIEEGAAHDHEHQHPHHHEHDHGHGHDHGHPHHDIADAAPLPEQEMTWTGALIGLTLHSIIDGVALGASMAAESPNPAHGGAAGLAVFLVIVLHRPFDAMTLGTLMAAGHRPQSMRHVVNVLFSLMVPVGVVLFFAGIGAAAGHGSEQVVGLALAFSAGVFLCIVSDLLPELQFHHHDRGLLSAALLLGLTLAWTVYYFESKTHGHEPHDNGPSYHQQRHDDPLR
jgi:zinc and cadmium transporter